MLWTNTYVPKSAHALLSPSQSAWVRYDKEKLEKVYRNRQRAALGTRLHKLAEDCIVHGVRLHDIPRAINMFVNDSIDSDLRPEELLYYSEYCFGTADAIGFDDTTDTLTVMDLKTGVSKPHREQLEVYSALFCLQYDKNPNDIIINCTIYQGEEKDTWSPDPEAVLHIMAIIKDHDTYLRELDEETS